MAKGRLQRESCGLQEKIEIFGIILLCYNRAPMMSQHESSIVKIQPLVLGILGSGQLGQMMAGAAKKIGCRTIVYDAFPGGPAAAVADELMVASFEDEKALATFAAKVDLITLEFENIPAATLTLLSQLKPVYPSAQVVGICQDRILEKEFLSAQHIPVAPFCVVKSLEELAQAVTVLQGETILKTAMLGYDGKGQVGIPAGASGEELQRAWNLLQTERAVLEKKIAFQAEGSVIVARSVSGEVAVFPPQENEHLHGILHLSRAPARFSRAVLEQAEYLGKKIAEALDVRGLITIEFFVLPDETLVVNELAPRPHNSGHHTLESSITSQFEQAIRAVIGWPLGSPQLLTPAIMLNLLGDLWQEGEPDWKPFLGEADIALHLYGKKEAKPGRKMGHVTFTGEERETLLLQFMEKIR